jgi:hypothetical protein
MIWRSLALKRIMVGQKDHIHDHESFNIDVVFRDSGLAIVVRCSIIESGGSAWYIFLLPFIHLLLS